MVCTIFVRMKEPTDILQSHGIAPTPMRILVLRCLMDSDRTLSLRELEELLHPADRSTIFRTLTLFEREHLIHCIADGGGAVRYEACHSHHHDVCDDRHVHFRCVRCGRTLCMPQQKVPSFNLPEGYSVHYVDCVVTGVCANCAQQK